MWQLIKANGSPEDRCHNCFPKLVKKLVLLVTIRTERRLPSSSQAIRALHSHNAEYLDMRIDSVYTIGPVYGVFGATG